MRARSLFVENIDGCPPRRFSFSSFAVAEVREREGFASPNGSGDSGRRVEAGWHFFIDFRRGSKKGGRLSPKVVAHILFSLSWSGN